MTFRPRRTQDFSLWATLVCAAVLTLILGWLLFVTRSLQADLNHNLPRAQAPAAHAGEIVLGHTGALRLAWFQYELSGAESARDEFQAHAREITTTLRLSKAADLPADERVLLDQLEASFSGFLSQTEGIEPLRNLRRGDADKVAAELQARFAPVLADLERLTGLQAERRASLANESAGHLRKLQRYTTLALPTGGLLIASVLGTMFFVARRRTAADLTDDPREKLASLGVLAAGVAHEIRNPLVAIKFRLFSLKKALGDGLATNEDYQTIQSEIDRLEKIVKSFLEFARPPEPRIASVSSTELFAHVHDLLGPEMERRGVRLVIDSTEPIEFAADRQQIEQVLINLAQNAADSMPGGGMVMLRARTGAAALGERSEEVALLDVIDSGPGIPRDIQRRLFDPFFSTKEGGTGLGLAIASRIVEKNGGRIQFSTQKGLGTTFTVLLPREVKQSENADSADRG
jgi:signal transduction histidine kinase